jgi:poly-gamma-glutamate system protein
MAIMWRPGKASRSALILVTGIALLGYLLVEALPKRNLKPHYRDKLRAAEIMAQGMEVIREQRVAIFGRIDQEHDPNSTGLIGSFLTPITSNTGNLLAKQIAANPNFGALLVSMYKKVGLKEGDVVAMAFSGSFPALNLAALVAAETIKLKPIVISSISSSNWGATDPELNWLDMERILFEKNIIQHRSVAVSMGGMDDRGVGLPQEGVHTLHEAIKRHNQLIKQDKSVAVELIDPPDLTSSFDLRMNIYKEQAGNQPIACYVNIGGGTGSVGNKMTKKAFAPGVNFSIPHAGRLPDSVLTRMSRKGIPIVHLIQIEKLAHDNGLPVKFDRPPRVGEGGVFVALGYNIILVVGVLIGLVGVIFVVLRIDYSHYLIRLRNNLNNREDQKSSPGS